MLLARCTSSLVPLLTLFVLSAMPVASSAQGLAELYRAALKGNPMLRSREYDVDRARAESDGARSRMLPQVLALGALSRNQYKDATTIGNPSYTGKRNSLILRQSLYDQVSRSRWESTQATVLQRDQELALTRLALFDEVLGRYLEALTAQDELEWLAAESQAATRQVDRLRAMRERQMAKVTDLAEADAYAQSLVTRTIDARNNQAVALARLTELCGIAVRQVPPLSRTTFDAVPGTQQEWVDDALRSYPRLLALTEAVEAARRAYESSRAEHLPQLAVTMSYTHSDQGYDNRRQPPYDVATVGIELRVPIYEGGRVDALTREAVARQGAAEQALETARREVEREIVTHWLSARANLARVGSTTAEVRAFEQTVKAQEVGLDLGVSRITDLLDARRRLFKSRAEGAKARYDYVRDVVALRIRSGNLTEDDVALWDRWFDSGVR
ncbi:TolC family outer membrane protein [Variovorax sp. ZT4R33]|uniref:TolC family outer membrane protein n=1 Tax=Variovorax sp. ZT4R33 TaxID=3443743 RepID=UPI003F48BFFC